MKASLNQRGSKSLESKVSLQQENCPLSIQKVNHPSQGGIYANCTRVMGWVTYNQNGEPTSLSTKVSDKEEEAK